jgi:hypothetical protein
MKRTIDDLPMVKASTLRAHGYIGPETKTTLIHFDDSGVEYQVGVTAKPLPCGAAWSLLICRDAMGGRSGCDCSRTGLPVASCERVDLSLAGDTH